jgi:circadian clock protein KaiC
MFGEMKRGITVLKMRGSIHDKNIREFIINDQGMGIGKPFANVTGILSGAPVHVREHELDRLETMFDERSA